MLKRAVNSILRRRLLRADLHLGGQVSLQQLRVTTYKRVE
jgi:hypothetical protein